MGLPMWMVTNYSEGLQGYTLKQYNAGPQHGDKKKSEKMFQQSAEQD